MTPVLLALALAAGSDLKPVYDQIQQQHAQNLTRLQQWIALPSIAAEGLNSEEGAQRMIDLLKDAGFQRAEKIPTDGKPGVAGPWTSAQAFSASPQRQKPPDSTPTSRASPLGSWI